MGSVTMSHIGHAQRSDEADPPRRGVLSPIVAEAPYRRQCRIAAVVGAGSLSPDVAATRCRLSELSPSGKEGLMRRPPVPPGEPTGLNKERPGQRTEARLGRAGSESRETRP